MLGARIFVGVVFSILGAGFLISTGLLVSEFRDGDWIALILAHSNLFLFFPVLGLLALTAFFLPATIFTHLYFAHVKFGAARFLFGFLVVLLATWRVDVYLDKSPRALWELSAKVIEADKGEAGDCQTGACRAPIGKVMQSLRENAIKRTALSKFARNCKADDFLEEREDMKHKRFCFPALTQLDGQTCCRVQKNFSAVVDSLHQNPGNRSQAALFDRIFMPFKIFFVVVVMVIGCMLAIWRDSVDLYYAEKVPAMERGIIIGAFAMLLWPIMDYGYLTTTHVLFGQQEHISQIRLSVVIVPWVLLLLFYFLRRLGKQGEMIGQISGVIAAGVAVVRYEEIGDWTTKLGIGMQTWILAVVLVLTAAGFIGLSWRWSIPAPGREKS